MSDDTTRPPLHSDDELAARFIARYGADLRYVTAHKQWLRWDGRRWSIDQTAWVMDRIQEICREAADELADVKRAAAQARSLASAATMRSVESVARHNPRVATVPDEFDAFDHLLGTPEGIVNLLDGSIDVSASEYMMTRLTAVAPAAPGAACPKWRQAIGEWTGGDAEMAAYLQRIAGYCLSGSTAERAVFILFGPQNDGAAMFLEAIRDLLGDYGMSSPMEHFMAAAYPRHPAEVALLKGRRMVAAVQAQEKGLWNVSRLLEVAGGSPIHARQMHGDFFAFKPTAKLMFRAVHLPSVEGATEEIRRLLHVLPFQGRIARDKELPDRLWSEREAILRWAMDGFLAYKKVSLNPPAAAIKATLEYIENSDAVNTWLSVCCETGADFEEPMASLWRSWQRWCAECREPEVNSQRWLSARLVERGFVRKHTMKGRVYTGMRLQPNGSREGQRA